MPGCDSDEYGGGIVSPLARAPGRLSGNRLVCRFAGFAFRQRGGAGPEGPLLATPRMGCREGPLGVFHSRWGVVVYRCVEAEMKGREEVLVG